MLIYIDPGLLEHFELCSRELSRRFGVHTSVHTLNGLGQRLVERRGRLRLEAIHLEEVAVVACDLGHTFRFLMP